MTTVLKWIAKFAIAFILLIIHWTLFLAFVLFLFLRSRSKHQRAMEEAKAAEAEQRSAASLLFECEIMNVSADNEDGVNRQTILYKCYRGDPLTFRHHPAEDQPYRVEVWSKFGQIGELAPHYAQQCAQRMEEGVRVEGTIKKMVNRVEGTAALGCLIEIMAEQPDETQDAAAEHSEGKE